MRQPCKAGVARVPDRVAAPAVGRHSPPGFFNFLLVPDFTFMAYSAAIETLRLANKLSDRELYAWNTISLDGERAIASNGLAIGSDYAASEEFPPGTLLVCGGVGVQRSNSPWLQDRPRKMAAKCRPMGAMCTGSLLLADARLRDGYRCTIHWERIAPLREMYPRLLRMA
jgi:transcriptional regulator GlxA family with amidase domain